MRGPFSRSSGSRSSGRSSGSRSSGHLDPQWQQPLRRFASHIRSGDEGGGDDSGAGDRPSGGGFRRPEMPRFVAPLQARMADRRYEYVQNPDDIRIDVREHVSTLTQPLLRAIVGVLALVAPHPVLPIIAFGVLVAAIVHRREGLGIVTTVLAGVLAAVVVGLAGSSHTSMQVHALLVLLLLLWLAADLFAWYDDRLIVTGRRIYRVYGLLTKHGPSMALSSITYIDVVVTPTGQAFNYGTLVLDSAAQRDDPLSHFAYLPDAVEVHKQILTLRTAAIRTLPRPQDMI